MPKCFADRIESTVSSLLGLMGVDADPVQSPAHILLSQHRRALLEERAEPQSLENLIRHIQQPPIRKVGVVDLETFCPEKQAQRARDEAEQPARLARLQHPGWRASRWIFSACFTRRTASRASPSSASRISATRSACSSCPCCSIRCSAGCARSRAPPSLRALLYMDEIYGYLPPTANPPSQEADDDPAQAGARVWPRHSARPRRIRWISITRRCRTSAPGSSAACRRSATRCACSMAWKARPGSAGSKFDRGEMEKLLSALGQSRLPHEQRA